MHVSSYDTNTLGWTHKQWDTPLAIGPEAALEWLSDDNRSHEEEEDTPPIGPLRYSGDTDRFVLVAAWAYGRQRGKVVAIFSRNKLPDADLQAILREQLPDEDLGEDDDEDSE